MLVTRVVAHRVGGRRARGRGRGRRRRAARGARALRGRARRRAARPTTRARARTAASAARSAGSSACTRTTRGILAGGDDPVGRWVAAALADEASGPRDARVAAVDIGTNSVRLLVADVDGPGHDARLTTVDRRTRITRLGQGVNETRRLDPEAIERTVAVLREYHEVITGHGVDARARRRRRARRATRPTATTSSTRSEQLLGVAARAASAARTRPRLEFLGATAGLAEPEPYLVVDVGGGSTEFIVGADEPEGLISVDVGCVRLTEQFLHSDPPSARGAERRGRRSCATTSPTSTGRSPARRQAKTLIGTAGTVWTMGAIELGVDASDSDAHPSLPAHPRRGRGRLPHARDRADRAPPAQSRARARAGST